MTTPSHELERHDCRRMVAAKEPQKHTLIAPIQSMVKRGRPNSASHGYIHHSDLSPLASYANSMFSQDPFNCLRTAPELSRSGTDLGFVPTYGPYLDGNTIASPGPVLGHYFSPVNYDSHATQNQLLSYEKVPTPIITDTTSIVNPYADTILGVSDSQAVIKHDVSGIHPAEFLAIFHVQGNACSHPKTLADRLQISILLNLHYDRQSAQTTSLVGHL